MYELDSNAENNRDYIKALQRQKSLLEQRSANTSVIKEETQVNDDVQIQEDSGDDLFCDGQHSLDDSFANE